MDLRSSAFQAENAILLPKTKLSEFAFADTRNTDFIGGAELQQALIGEGLAKRDIKFRSLRSIVGRVKLRI